VLSVNSREQLAQVDAILQDRIQREHRANGVSITSGLNVYVEAGATIGQDTVIHPFSFVGRDASIGADCTIGPFGVVPPDRDRPGRDGRGRERDPRGGHAGAVTGAAALVGRALPAAGAAACDGCCGDRGDSG
jgi:hypothetical protein